jgi:hypothetical protein
MQQPDVIIDAPNIESPGSAQDPRWRREYEAFMRLLPELLKTHAGKYVAVHNAAIVAVGDTFRDAAVAAYQRVGYVPLHVGLVSKTPRQPVRVPSPRVVSPALSA